MKIFNWVAYLFISFFWFLSLIYGMPNMRRLAKKLEQGAICKKQTL